MCFRSFLSRHTKKRKKSQLNTFDCLISKRLLSGNYCFFQQLSKDFFLTHTLALQLFQNTLNVRSNNDTGKAIAKHILLQYHPIYLSSQHILDFLRHFLDISKACVTFWIQAINTFSQHVTYNLFSIYGINPNAVLTLKQF